MSQPLLDEIANVLSRSRIKKKYGLNDFDIQRFVDTIKANAQVVTPTGKIHICRDPNDDLILETAILGGANYVVSRDEDITRDSDLRTRLAEHDITPITVQQFIDLLTHAREPRP